MTNRINELKNTYEALIRKQNISFEEDALNDSTIIRILIEQKCYANFVLQLNVILQTTKI